MSSDRVDLDLAAGPARPGWSGSLVEVVMAGVVRVEATGGVCWMDGLPAVAGERLPGRGRRVRLLCELHDAAVFGGPEAVAAVRARRAAAISAGAADVGELAPAEPRARR